MTKRFSKEGGYGGFSPTKHLRYWDKLLAACLKRTGVDVVKMIAEGKSLEDVQREMVAVGFKPITEQAYFLMKNQLTQSKFVGQRLNEMVSEFLLHNLSYVIDTKVVLETVITSGFARFLKENTAVDLKTLLRAIEIKAKLGQFSETPESIARQIGEMLKSAERKISALPADFVEVKENEQKQSFAVQGQETFKGNL